MCRRDWRAGERARQIGKPSVGRVGTTLGDVYQGRVCVTAAADSADGIDYRTHTRTQTPTTGWWRK